MTYSTVDYSTDEQQQWQRIRDGLRELQPKFEAKGPLGAAAQSLSGDVEIFTPLADRQEMRSSLSTVANTVAFVTWMVASFHNQPRCARGQVLGITS